MSKDSRKLLYLYNSLSRKKEAFQPLNPPNVGLYVCGPTVYSDVHLGNCRTFISFDLIFRYLQHLGYKVRYVRNITDAGHLENDADSGEDKIAQKAKIEQLEPMEVVQKYTVGFRRIMEEFNALPPSIEPTATGHIVEQIEMVKKLIENGYAYEKNGSVYFDVEKYDRENDYGMLSGRKIDELQSGTRDLEAQDEKRSPLDFAVWKKASESHIMRWPSPWGEGFPGWHLECSVMSTKYLGEQFDLHGGGMDLKFPHHEAEIAQNKGCHNVHSVKYWLHANMLTLNGKRMSKSTGNTLLPEELFTGNTDKLSKGFDPAVVRFFMMQAHYRSVLDFGNDALQAAEKGYHRLMNAITSLQNLNPAKESKGDFDVEKWVGNCYAAMNDDFNSPVLIAELFEAASAIQKAREGIFAFSESELETLRNTLHAFVHDIMGIKAPGASGNSEKLKKAIEVLINLRNKAREEKDWALSDQIRDQLAEAGVQLKDGKNGTTYSLEP